MRWATTAAAIALLMGCQAAGAADSLSLTFGSYKAAPVVLTHFAIESPLAETQRVIVASDSEWRLPRDDGRSNALELPRDAGGDGYWKVSAQWAELQTDRAWRAEVKVPISALNETYDMNALNVIFGPNGLLVIGSDTLDQRVNVAAECGRRVPSADHAWRRETAQFPDLAASLAFADPVPSETICPAPSR